MRIWDTQVVQSLYWGRHHKTLWFGEQTMFDLEDLLVNMLSKCMMVCISSML